MLDSGQIQLEANGGDTGGARLTPSPCCAVSFDELRLLALDPTSTNFQTIQAKLEALTSDLSRYLADPSLLAGEGPAARAFLRELPAHMKRLRTLMQAPLGFYAGLEALAAAHFGSYGRTGELRSLQPRSSSRTVLHL